jgi:hypothetical protein
MRSLPGKDQVATTMAHLRRRIRSPLDKERLGEREEHDRE